MIGQKWANHVILFTKEVQSIKSGIFDVPLCHSQQQQQQKGEQLCRVNGIRVGLHIELLKCQLFNISIYSII